MFSRKFAAHFQNNFLTTFPKSTSEGLLLYYNSTTIIKLESSSNSVVPSAFDCQGIDGFVTIIIICLRRWTSKCSQLGLLWKVSKNPFEKGQWGSIFLVKLRIYNLALSTSRPWHVWNFSEQLLCRNLSGNSFFFHVLCVLY